MRYAHEGLKNNVLRSALDPPAKSIFGFAKLPAMEIDRATHNVHSDNPADFAAALGAFLDDVL